MDARDLGCVAVWIARGAVSPLTSFWAAKGEVNPDRDPWTPAGGRRGQGRREQGG